MKHYDLTIAEGSKVTNLITPIGVTFPTNENAGELFFRSDLSELYVYDGTSWAAVGSAGSTITNTQITATANQTIFNVSYTVGNLLVHLNGLKLLDGVDYTATDGSTVVLTTGANANDVLDFEAFTVSSISDFYTKAQSDSNFVNVSGDTMTGTLVLNADPVNNLEAATKQYVDNYSVPVSGGTFTGPVTVQGVIKSEAATPFLTLRETGAAVDEKQWEMVASGGTLTHRLRNDAESSSATYMAVYRTGMNIDSIAFRVGAGTSTSLSIDTAAVNANKHLKMANGANILMSVDNSALVLSGGTASNSGNNIILYGSTASTPNETVFRYNGNEAMRIKSNGTIGIQKAVEMENNQAIFARDSGGTLRTVLYGRFGDALYLDGGAGGLYIRSNNANVTSMVVDSAGRITKPNQPAFMARADGAQTNIPINTNVTIRFLKFFDQDNNYSNTTYMFTTPVTGKYQFNILVRMDSFDTAAAFYRFILRTSNRDYQYTIDPTKYSADLAYYTFTQSVLADMDVNDTAYVVMYQSGGTAQGDILGGVNSTFSGFLVA